jgi:hypothetical protein
LNRTYRSCSKNYWTTKYLYFGEKVFLGPFRAQEIEIFFPEKRKAYILNHIVELLQTKPNETKRK